MGSEAHRAAIARRGVEGVQHLGRLAMARKELEKLYADAPDYEDVQALLRDPEWGTPATGA